MSTSAAWMSRYRSDKGAAFFALAAGAALTVCAHRALIAGGPTCGAGLIWFTALAFAVLWLATLSWLEFDVWVTAILVGATLLYLNYAAYTDLTERNYDGPSFVYYSKYLLERGRLPPVEDCVACGHPPLSALLGAASIVFARWTGLSNDESSLQGLSLLFSLGFVLLGVRTIQHFTQSPVAQRSGAALLAFWPNSVISSIRVHDDPLLSCLGAGILYCLVRWQKNDRSRDLVWAMALASLAVFTKANSYAWVLVLLIAVTTRGVRDRFRGWRAAQAGLAWAVAAASIIAASALRPMKARPTNCSRILGKICNISSEHFVGNTWVNYLHFDFRFFLTQPYLISDPHDPKHDYVLNVLLKSSVLGAMPLGPEFDDRLSAALAVLLTTLVLGLIAYLLVGVRAAVFRGFSGRNILLLASLFMLGQLMALRIAVPLSWNADFRYVFVLLVPITVYYSKLVEYWQARSKVMFVAGAGLAGLTVLASVLLFRPTGARVKGHPDPAFASVPCAPAAFSEVRPSGTSVNDPRVVEFGPRQELLFTFPEGTRMSQLDVSLDADDEYDILFRGDWGGQHLDVGPTAGSGLARYQRVLSLPSVRTVTIRPLNSDGYYALGHLRLLP